jgi:hypothetical protein
MRGLSLTEIPSRGFCYRGPLVGPFSIRRIGCAQGFQSVEARFETANAFQNRPVCQILRSDLFLIRLQQDLKVSLKGCQHADLLARLLLERCHTVREFSRGMDDLLQSADNLLQLLDDLIGGHALNTIKVVWSSSFG